MRTDGPGEQSQSGDLLFRLVAAAALTLGTLSGGYTISTSDDRYRAADASKDFQVRDVQLQQLEKRIHRNENDIDRIDRQGPSNPNESVKNAYDSLEKRVDILENSTHNHD